MAIGTTLIIFIAIHLFLIWMITRMKKLRYKLLIGFLMALILFGYFSFNAAFEGHEVSLTDFKGVAEASGIYFSWLNSAFGNAQTITSRVVKNNSEDDPAGK